MMKLATLFEYQKFNPNTGLEEIIADVHSRYSSNGVELADEEMNVSAAGECVNKGWWEKVDDKK